ncbi:hypothetical protein [Eikenella sp. Marseille-P7795]|uniref:hypothetical protein n=1 Tax=Eikenella sp. Marseille-P7795 TaxID=2866577 RepID=UPI001CE47F11|nr:hypothetical protein [Eikenella sp. Marseille-P7795]
MNPKPQTTAYELEKAISHAYRVSHLKPFNIARIEQEARKLFRTNEAFRAYTILGAVSVFKEDLTYEQKIAEMQVNFDAARRLPHSIYDVEMCYFNSLIRLHMRESAYELAEYLFELSADNPDWLRACFNRGSFTGQLGLMEKVIARLDKLGKDTMNEKERIGILRASGVAEEHLIRLLAQAGHAMKESGVAYLADAVDTDGDAAYLTLLAVSDADPEAVADCDIAISRAKVRYALEHGLDLSRLVIGCELAGADL